MLKSNLIKFQERIIEHHHSPNWSFVWFQMCTGSWFCNIDCRWICFISTKYTNIADSSILNIFIRYCEWMTFFINIIYIALECPLENKVFKVYLHLECYRNTMQWYSQSFLWYLSQLVLQQWLCYSQQRFES